MKIIGATKEQLEAALAHVNEYFHDNITLNLDERKPQRGGVPVFMVTLGVKDSKEIGSSRRNGRQGQWKRLAHACWHAYGVFFDCLPAGTRVFTHSWITPGAKWVDFEVQRNPTLMASHACNCMEWNNGGVLPFPVNAS